MNSLESTFRKQLFLVCTGGAVVLLLLVLTLVHTSISPRNLALIGLAWWVAMFACLWPIIRKFQRGMAEYKKSRIAQGLPPESREECLRKIRNSKRLVLLLVLLFPVDIWLSSDKSRLSMLEDLGVWIVLAAILVWSIVKRQKELKSL